MSDPVYIPSTGAVRDQFAAYEGPRRKNHLDYSTEGNLFDKWLAAHDSEVAEKALEDAADAWLHGGWSNTPRKTDRDAERMAASQYVGDWLLARVAFLRVQGEQKWK